MTTTQANRTQRPPRKSAGFTLLELLVTLFVVAIGVLGTASLQALSLKMAQAGQLRSQAVIAGLDLLERIEANNPAAVAGSYAPATIPTSFAKDCATTFCQPSELATYDLVQFITGLQAQLPGASATVTVAGAGTVTYTIQIDWEERIAKGVGTTVDTGVTSNVGATGKTEKFSYSVSKMYPDRSLVI
jgi:type IV pilus assembly protein PilV